MRLALLLIAFAACAQILTVPALARAQAAEIKPSESKPDSDAKQRVEIYQTIYLSNASQTSDLSDIQTAIRNMEPRVRVFGIPSQNAISIHGTADELTLARQIVADLDRPRRVYRLTFTIDENDNSKHGESQDFSLIVASGERSVLKQGGRMPIITGKSDGDDANHNAQVQYLDVGLNIEATVEGFADGIRLRSKVEQSSPSDQQSGFGAQDPVLRQTLVDGNATLTLGKPLVLGSLAIPGTTHTKNIQVVAELVK